MGSSKRDHGRPEACLHRGNALVENRVRLSLDYFVVESKYRIMNVQYIKIFQSAKQKRSQRRRPCISMSWGLLDVLRR